MPESPARQTLVIIDPGLATASGHHAGLLLSLAATTRKRHLSLVVYANTDVDSQAVAYFASIGIQLRPVFHIHYYQHLFATNGQQLNIAQVQRLSKQYCQVLQQIKAEYGEAVTCIHHTMDYPHALALNLALEFQPVARHLILLMFSPKADKNEGPKPNTKPLYYKLAFQRLLAREDVEFFAAEAELAENYQQLLELEYPPAIYPCCLLNEASFKRNTAEPRQGKNILLYIGDAKADKGFNRLPEILERLNTGDDSPYTYVIHYTLTGQDERLKKTAAELNHLATRHPCLEIKTRLLNDAEFNRLICSSSAILFNYCGTAYKNKNSGILWLAVFYRLNLLFLTNNWLCREANRLGSPARVTPLHRLAGRVDDVMEHPQPNQKITQPYRSLIFRAFDHWLIDRAMNKQAVNHHA